MDVLNAGNSVYSWNTVCSGRFTMTDAVDAYLSVRDGREWLRRARCGDLEGAWRASDRIWSRNTRPNEPTIARHRQRVWDGTDLRGRRVLVRCYHSLGDTIQFIRYASLLQLVSCEVIVQAPPALLPLLHTVVGINRLVPLHDHVADVEYDVDIEVMELPYAFRTTLHTIPGNIPYLRAAPLSLMDDRPRVGVVWRSGDCDQERSMTFALVRRLLEESRVSWYSLQLERDVHEQHSRLQWLDVRGLTTTAQAIAAMDLVISVDTMSAHLAGALAVPVWTLLPYDADWRWMQNRSDSPWYPTMRLYRQPRPGDWSTVIGDVRRALDSRTFEPRTLN